MYPFSLILENKHPNGSAFCISFSCFLHCPQKLVWFNLNVSIFLVMTYERPINKRDSEFH